MCSRKVEESCRLEATYRTSQSEAFLNIGSTSNVMFERNSIYSKTNRAWKRFLDETPEKHRLSSVDGSSMGQTSFPSLTLDGAASAASHNPTEHLESTMVNKQIVFFNNHHTPITIQ